MGKWDPKKDREPDKKNEVAFKEYLMAKYQRKTWYKSPSEVKKEEQQVTPATGQVKIQTPTTSVKVEAPFTLTLSLSLTLSLTLLYERAL
jgi:hypothetical protein